MRDILDIIENIDTIYNSNSSLAILKDYERVFDELDLYVFENWRDGEIIQGPQVDRHWVTCSFMWSRDKMPNPEAAKRLSEYGCQVKYHRDTLIKPRKITNPSDIRPNSKKGKIDEHPVWVVEIMMPKKLMLEVFRGYHNQMMDDITPFTNNQTPVVTEQPVEATAMAQEAPVAGEPNVAA